MIQGKNSLGYYHKVCLGVWRLRQSVPTDEMKEPFFKNLKFILHKMEDPTYQVKKYKGSKKCAMKTTSAVYIPVIYIQLNEFTEKLTLQATKKDQTLF